MLLIKGGYLHLPNQEVIAGDVLIEKDKIVKVGQNITNETAEIFDAKGKEIFPGFILPVTSVGLTDYANLRQGDSNETAVPCNPSLHVRYALDGREIALQRYWLGGITSIGAAPANGALLAGQMGVYHVSGGMAASQLCVKDTVAVKGNFTSEVKSTFVNKNMAPMTRMGMASCFRNILKETQIWLEDETPAPNKDYETLSRVLKGELPILVNANTSVDISDVLNIAEEFQIKVILNGIYEGDKVIEQIEKLGAALIIGDLFDSGAAVWYESDFDKLLSKRKNLEISIGCSTGSVGKENLLWNACRLVQKGYSAADVLDLMTVQTAKILGVDDLIGSIKEGLFADLVIYNNNPLEKWSADLEATIVAGKIVYRKGE